MMSAAIIRTVTTSTIISGTIRELMVYRGSFLSATSTVCAEAESVCYRVSEVSREEGLFQPRRTLFDKMARQSAVHTCSTQRLEVRCGARSLDIALSCQSYREATRRGQCRRHVSRLAKPGDLTRYCAR